jgi:FkbM family methyltransferase
VVFRTTRIPGTLELQVGMGSAYHAFTEEGAGPHRYRFIDEARRRGVEGKAERCRQSNPEIPQGLTVSFFKAWLTRESLSFRVRALKARFRDQRAEFAVIRAHLRPGDIACDVGANKGSFVYWLSRWVGHGRVVAFEPQPELARLLTELCRADGLDNVTVEAKAVYSHAGRQELFLPSGYQPGASLTHVAAEARNFTTVSVPLVALDDYFEASDPVALLKIDVEGAELGVFRGAERILRRHAPLLVFECENRHLAPGNVFDVFSYLAALGYEGSFISQEEVLPIARFDAAIHQRQDGKHFWKRRSYCNNFVFRKKSPLIK